MPRATDNNDRSILSVSELNRQARITIEQRFQMVWVMGEMSNFARPRSGHWYFSLKDENAQVRCAMFANRNRSVRLQPGDGQLVIVRGRVSLYEGRGDFQVIVDHMEAAGEGALRQAFDQLKVKLAAEGLFDTDGKANLPRYPQHCAVITSPTGAALKDVLAVFRRRYPAMRVTVVPSAVQGAAAEQQLLDAIARTAALQPDVVLMTRGGGSLEDLWSFNLESVARALAACPFPTVSAVGHEIDVTISDFVADMRAPTPSAAAELIAPDQQAIALLFARQRLDLQRIVQRQLQYRQLVLTNLAQRIISPRTTLEQANQRVDDAAMRISQALRNRMRFMRMNIEGLQNKLNWAGPARALERTQLQLRQLQARMGRATRSNLQRQHQQLQNTARMLHSVSPLPTVTRGYALVTDENGTVVTSTAELSAGQRIRTYFKDGSATAEVQQVEPERTLENL